MGRAGDGGSWGEGLSCVLRTCQHSKPGQRRIDLRMAKPDLLDGGDGGGMGMNDLATLILQSHEHL